MASRRYYVLFVFRYLERYSDINDDDDDDEKIIFSFINKNLKILFFCEIRCQRVNNVMCVYLQMFYARKYDLRGEKRESTSK